MAGGSWHGLNGKPWALDMKGDRLPHLGFALLQRVPGRDHARKLRADKSGLDRGLRPAQPVTSRTAPVANVRLAPGVD